MKHKPLQNNLLTMFFVLLFLTVFLAGCTSLSEPTPAVTQDQGSILQEVSASGEVVPKKWAVLSFVNGGFNLTLKVSEGEVVDANQVLVSSSDERLLTQLMQAEAVLARAQSAYDLVNESPTELALASAQAGLANAEAVLQQLEDSFADELRINAAEADVERARIQLEETRKSASQGEISAALADLRAAQYAHETAQAAFSLKAPFSGEIIEFHVNPQESVAAFQPVVTIADLTEFEVVTTDLSEVDVLRLESGQEVNLVFDAIPNQNFKGTIERIAQKSSGGSAVYYDVFISLNEPPTNLRWGMTAYITVPNK